MPLPQNNLKPSNKGGKNRFNFSIYWMYAAILIVMGAMLYLDNNTIDEEVPFSKFDEYVQSGGVTKLVVYADKKEIEGVLNDSLASKIFHESQYNKASGVKARITSSFSTLERIDADIQQWRSTGVFNGEVTYERSGALSGILFSFGPIVLLVVLWFFIMKRMSGGGAGGGGIFSVGKSKAQLFDKNDSNSVTFKDVAGLAEAKVEIQEIVDFLKNPKRYTELGGKIPKGALLVGPPGTGKTLLAKAVAGEANVPFFSMSGSDFVEMFVGVGASRVRDLFKQAKEKAPCIVFIDEIDAVGRARGRNNGIGGNDERENTLNQLLTEMDGFGTNSGVICLAATNRAEILDKALLRAGRFDRQIFVDLPDVNDRVEIFKVHLRNIKLAQDLDIELLARQTPGFSGAEIANVCNEAALIAARHDKKDVSVEDFNAAIDRIIGGLEKKNKMATIDEKRGVAVHEAGHATVSWHLEYGDPLVKVTIVPRGRALGAAWYMPEERQRVTAQALLDQICSLMGGRAAEELVLGQVCTGALNDLERATKIAYSLVVYYGMSDAIPNISYYDSSGQNYGFTKPYSEERSKTIDQEVSRILSEQYQRAKDILTKYKEGHAKLTEELFNREVIFTADVEAIFGKRQWVSRADEIAALNSGKDIDLSKPSDSAEDNNGNKEEGAGNEEKATESKPRTTPPPYNPNANQNQNPNDSAQ